MSISKKIGPWKFAKINTIEERIFNPLLEDFVKYGLSGLVRENIQNALDAKLPDNSEPVQVKICAGEISVQEIEGIADLRERIECLEGGNAYASETVKYMKKCIQAETVPYISFEDSNTKGLTEDNWDYYAYQKGAHYIESDDNLESARGGSHGVGKIASNAASNIHLMFFSNCDAEGNRHIGGTIQLLEHQLNDQCYRSTGYFTDGSEEEGYIPYNNTDCGIFSKDTRGLKIVIPFVRQEHTEQNRILQAVCDSFFLSILDKKLIVTVNEQIVDSTTINSIICNPTIYPDQDPNKMRKVFTPLYVKTYQEVEGDTIQVRDKTKQYNFILYFQLDETIGRGSVGIVRTIGMKIEDFKVTGKAKMPFNAVLVPASNTEDVFLKSLENESHTKLIFESIRDEKAQKNAKSFITNLTKVLGEYISAKYQENNPTDGVIDTSDLIYSVENRFRKELEKRTATVSITKVDKTKTSTIVKRKKKKKRPIDRVTTTSPGPNTPGTTPTPKSGDDEGKKKVHTYSVKTNQVKRVILANKEQTVLDLKGTIDYQGELSGDLHLKIVDGKGDVEESGLDLSKCYSTVKDKHQDTDLTILSNCIENVSIQDGVINLQMELLPEANRALKYVYYLEVYR